MRKIEFQGVDIYYEIHGEGLARPLVLLHGFMEDSSIWEHMVNELKTQRSIVVVDLPGHGRSGGYSEILTMESMAQVVKKVLEKENLKEVSLAGHSMGGYVSLEFLNKFPMMVKSLVLINSTPAADSEEKKRNRERAIDLVKQNQKAFQSMAISNLFEAGHREEFQLEIEALKSRAYGMNLEHIVAAIKGMKIRTNHIPIFSEFHRQKIIIAGKDDPVLDFNELKLLAKRCKSEFYSLENGHMSFIEDREELTKKMYFID